MTEKNNEQIFTNSDKKYLISLLNKQERLLKKRFGDSTDKLEQRIYAEEHRKLVTLNTKLSLDK